MSEKARARFTRLAHDGWCRRRFHLRHPGVVYVDWVGNLGVGHLFLTVKLNPDRSSKPSRSADERVQRELNTFVQRNGMTEVIKVRGDLDNAIAAYKGHDDALARELW